MTEPTNKYRFCNHHHEMTDDHEWVDFGTGKFIANKKAIPLLKALNELGLVTRTHHVDEESGFVSIIIDDKIQCEIRIVHERDSDRIQFNGKPELLLSWRK